METNDWPQGSSNKPKLRQRGQRCIPSAPVQQRASTRLQVGMREQSVQEDCCCVSRSQWSTPDRPQRRTGWQGSPPNAAFPSCPVSTKKEARAEPSVMGSNAMTDCGGPLTHCCPPHLSLRQSHSGLQCTHHPEHRNPNGATGSAADPQRRVVQKKPMAKKKSCDRGWNAADVKHWVYVC